MTQFEALLKELFDNGVEFVLIGGIAAVVHGSSYETRDLDISYNRSRENIHRLVHVLKGLQARLRGAPPDVPFQLDEKSIQMGMNFTFESRLGDLDILGEVSGLGSFQEVRALSEPLDLYGMKINVLSLEGLIRAKRASRRAKDLIHLKELEAIRELKKKKL